MLTPALSPLTLAAIDSLRAHTNQLAERFPQHRFTFGYIGNLERWGDDDRNWRIFTRYMLKDTRSSVSFGLGGTESLNYGPDVQRRIDAWVDRLADLFAAGVIVHQS